MTEQQERNLAKRNTPQAKEKATITWHSHPGNTVKLAAALAHRWATHYKDITYTEELLQFFWGCTLGDSYIAPPRHEKGQSCICFSHKVSDLPYLESKYELLQKYNLTRGPVKIGERAGRCFGKPTDDIYYYAYFRSGTHPLLSSLRQEFYINAIKVIPDSIASKLGPIGFAYLYQDDGSMSRRSLTIATYSFKRADVEKLKVRLEALGIQSTIENHPEGPLLCICKDRRLFIDMVSKYIHPSMNRKLCIN